MTSTIPDDRQDHRDVNANLPVWNFAFVVLIGALLQVLLAYYGVEMSKLTNVLWTTAFSFAVAWVVESDRRRRGLSAPFEYAAFMFFLWPILTPHYGFRTRGWRGLWMGLALVSASFLPALARLATEVLLGQ